MQSFKKVLFALLVAALAAGFATPAMATPVTDQYTEERPDPGGPADPADPVKTKKPPRDAGISNTGPDYVPPSTDYTDPTYEDAEGQTAAGKRKAAKKRAAAKAAEEKKAKGQNGRDGKSGSDQNDQSVVPVVSTSGGGGDGDGLGWVFPAILIVIAGAVGYAAGKRNRSGLAA